MLTHESENHKYFEAKMEVLRSEIKMVDLKVETMRETLRFFRNTLVGSILSPVIVGIILYFLLRQ